MADGTTWTRDEQSGQYVFDVSVHVNAPIERCFAYWENFENFPRLLHYIDEVQPLGENRWHWAATVAGQHAEWDARLTALRVNEVISWESTDGLRNSGSVFFTPDGTGCRITVHLLYDPPFGILGDLVAERRTNDEFYHNLSSDLERFKLSVEGGQTGDIYRAA